MHTDTVHYLQRAFLGMLSTTTVQAWRFDPEVPDLLFPTVYDTMRKWSLQLVLLRLQLLLLGRCQRLLLRLFRLEVLVHGSEITEGEVSDLGTIALWHIDECICVSRESRATNRWILLQDLLGCRSVDNVPLQPLSLHN